MQISIPYGRTHLHTDIPDERINAVLTSRLEDYVPTMGEQELVEEALRNPIGSKTLEELVQGKENIVLIEIGQQRCQIARFLDGRTGCNADIHAHFSGNNASQRSFT